MKYSIIIIILLPFYIFSQENSFKPISELKQVTLNQIKEQQRTNESAPLFSEQKTKKNAGLAVIYSLLLPGMGELYADSYETGKYFTIADGVLWATFIGMNTYAGWQKDRYVAYAQSNASINTAGKDADYYATIGEYLDIDQYNDEKAFERNYDEMYNTEAYFWKWSSTEERRTYRDMWTSSEQTYNDVRFVVGGLILNRVISAINAVRLVSAYNSNLQETSSWNVSMGFVNYPNLPSSMAINFSKTF